MGIARILLRLATGGRLPVASGELRVRGPESPITIRRDGNGVPHIDAQSDSDAAFAMGFCQGQDRAGQLEVLWRVGRGRLAEWVGAKGLPADRMSRRIGFRRSAEAQLPVLSESARTTLNAFAHGVTVGSTRGLTAKPHEFAILGGEPSAWDGADVLAVLKLQSFLLPSNWDVELARLRILRSDGPDAVRALDPVNVWPDDGGLRTASLDALAKELAAIAGVLPRGGGSNNWAIGGSRTASGKPLLASDPHLAPTAPGPWHLAHVRTPEWSAAGASLVGTPGFPIGHNGFAAWGVTAGLTDNTDLVLEPDGPFEAIHETIRVKGAAEVIEEVRITPRGPVVSPLFTGVSETVSLQAVWLQPLPLEGFLGVPRAKSFDEFRRCFAAWPMLPLNVVYADESGTIGWQLIGQLPRRCGPASLLPRRSTADWDGLIPFEEMPFTVNPPCGFIATANQPPDTPEPAKFGFDYIDAYRADTIADEIAKRAEPWDAAACGMLQQDTRSRPWEAIRDAVLAIPASDPQVREALDLLREWDGRVSIDSPAAAIFELFVAEMCVRVAKAKAPKSWEAALGDAGLGAAGHNLFADRRVSHLVPLLCEQPPGWFVSWPVVMADVLGGIVRRLRREVGPSPPFWAWGHLRKLRLDHPLFGKHRWLGPAFNLGPVPCGGDQNTISQAGARPLHPDDFTHNLANLRTVFDLADLAKSRFVLCGGQSGNPCSPHHADQLPLWQAGESIAIPWSQDDVIRASASTLRLLPDAG
ncbi:MAG: penicillin acylase family protein [Gemmataceae bacterium]